MSHIYRKLSFIVLCLTINAASLWSDSSKPPLDPLTIPKFVNQLTKPHIFVPKNQKYDCDGKIVEIYQVEARKFKQQVLPDCFPKTTVFGYGGRVRDPNSQQNSSHHEVVFSSPGPTFEAVRDHSIFVHWVNELRTKHIFPVDPTIGFANPNNMPTPTDPNTFPPFPPGFRLAQSPIPIVTHLHGGVTPSRSDGHPQAWFTANEALKGPAFFSSTFHYYNAQLPTTLWYHDHTIGMTRLNVGAGLAGFYLIRDPNDDIAPLLPSGKYEIPLMIQDRSFNTDGSLFFTKEGDNPTIHPYWDPEFFGNTIVVNGKVWPNLDVERRQYRFRIVNASNARFYNFKLSNGSTFIQIGGDGSYLPAPVTISSLLLAPAERADILIDFSNISAGKKILLLNDAVAPFPGGDPADPNTVGQIMQFTVLNTRSVHPAPLPNTLIDIPILNSPIPPKLFTLNEQEGPDGPIAVLIDGQHFDADITELPQVATTEEWYFQNLTEDSHPIHIHLVQFLLEDRQTFDVDAFKTQWEILNGSTLPLNHPTVRLNVEDPNFNFLTGPVEEPSPQESGWKDTFIAEKGKVTRVLVRFAPQYSQDSDLIPGVNPFPFDPSEGPGYVWHCHILDHEDNDMMRPMKIQEN